MSAVIEILKNIDDENYKNLVVKKSIDEALKKGYVSETFEQIAEAFVLTKNRNFLNKLIYRIIFEVAD